jgi:hypothetical protein
LLAPYLVAPFDSPTRRLKKGEEAEVKTSKKGL